MTADVCVVGSFMTDLVATAPRRPDPGETLVGHSFAIHLGGKGYNQAVAARRAGARVSFVGAVGADDFGRDFLAGLRAEGIAADHVLVHTEIGTGVGLPVVEDDGQNSIVIVPRANLTVTPEQVTAARAVIEAADVLLLQLEIPVAATVTAARIARAAGTVVVLNPAPFQPIPAELLELVDVLVPNEIEARSMTGAGADDPVDAVLDAVDRALPGRVVMTLGSQGIAVADGPGSRWHLPAHRVAAVDDTVGAGDTFCGVLGAGLASGQPLVDAAVRANAAASIAITRPGGAPSAPSAEEIEPTAATGPRPVALPDRPAPRPTAV